MSRLIVLVGPSCSGKTTWATQYVKENTRTAIVSRDTERIILFGEYRMGNKQEETVITQLCNTKTNILLGQKYDVILDNTHLQQKYLDEIVDTFGYIADIEFRIFDACSKEEAIRRDGSASRCCH